VKSLRKARVTQKAAAEKRAEERPAAEAEAEKELAAARSEFRAIETEPGSESLFIGYSGPDPSG
jgi:hypothetical protein